MGTSTEERETPYESKFEITYREWLVVLLIVAESVAVLGFFLITQAAQPWHYIADIAVMATSLAVVIGFLVYTRQDLSGRLQRFQAQLVMRTMELQKIAARDELTNLYNRCHFYQQLQGELEKARSSKQPLAIGVENDDRLKAINDTHGHQVGDFVLRNLARVMIKHTRGSDVAARLGGDEFGIVMPDTDKRGAFGLAHRLWRELEQGPTYEENDIHIWLTVSIGVSGFPWGGESVDEMIHWADTDMYANKVSSKLPTSSLTESDPSPDIEKAPSDYGLA